MKKLFLIGLFFINFYSCDSLLEDVIPKETKVESGNVTPATLLQPSRNTIKVTLRPILKWNSGESSKKDLLSFDLYLDTTENVNTIIAKDLKETEFVFQNKLNYSTKYYWKIVSKIPKESIDSEIFTFTTEEKRVPVLSVNIENSDFRLGIGLSKQLDFTLNPSDSTNKNISWSSDRPSVADVSENGNITGLSPGTATITATSSDSGTSDKITVTVIDKSSIASTGISLDRSSASISISTSLRLTETVIPQNATNKNVSWSSSNPNIATVEPDGTVTGVQDGTAIITATTEDGNFKATTEITVGNISVTDIELIENGIVITEKNLVIAGDDYQILPRVLPESATVKSVTYSSVDESVATVSNDGLVIALAPGTTIIRVITNDGAKEATLRVTVTEGS